MARLPSFSTPVMLKISSALQGATAWRYGAFKNSSQNGGFGREEPVALLRRGSQRAHVQHVFDRVAVGELKWALGYVLSLPLAFEIYFFAIASQEITTILVLIREYWLHSYSDKYEPINVIGRMLGNLVAACGSLFRVGGSVILRGRRIKSIRLPQA